MRIRSLVWLLIGLTLLPEAAFAKRTPAPRLPPIVHNGVRYNVPNDRGTVGYVVASDFATGKQLWKRTVFRKCICPLLEQDVQWVFIKEMRLEGERLILVDERGRTYALDLSTRKVQRLKRETPTEKTAAPNRAGAPSFFPGRERRRAGEPELSAAWGLA